MGGGRVRGAKGGKINSNTESRERRFHYFNTLPPAGRPEKVTTRQLLYPPKTEQNFATTDGRLHISSCSCVCLTTRFVVFFPLYFGDQSRSAFKKLVGDELFCGSRKACWLGEVGHDMELLLPRLVSLPARRKGCASKILRRGGLLFEGFAGAVTRAFYNKSQSATIKVFVCFFLLSLPDLSLLGLY